MNFELSITNLKSTFFTVVLLLTLSISHAKVIPQNMEIFQKPLEEPSPYTEYVEKVFAAVQKMLVFYDRRYKKLIVDGVYGLRVLEGVVDVILKEHREGVIKMSSNTQKRVTKLGIVASRIAVKSYPYLKSFSEHYFNEMGFTVMEPWSNIKPLKKLSDDKYDYNPHQYAENDMEEDQQDKCFKALAGDKKKGIASCTVSDYCWKTNTKPGQKSYFLTHQLLYFLLGQVKGCSEVFESRFKAESYSGGIERFMSISCHAMLPEMNKQEKVALKKMTLGEIDLYLEQAVVCGMIGYSDFLSLDRLDLILSWRHKEGCFGFTDEIGGREEEENGNSESQEPEMEHRNTMRKLTVTRDLEGGCEVHSTGVGIGLLALYLRWLLHLSSDSHVQSYGNKVTRKDLPSSYLILLFFTASLVIILHFSKRVGLRLHRNKFVKTLCPCV